MDFLQSLKLFLISSLYVLSWASSEGCGPGIKSDGHTFPAGDITLRSGQSLDILCVLNDAAAAKYGPNGSQYMRVISNNENIPVEMVNSTAIKLHIANHPKTESLDYACMVNDSLVCHNIVAVGTPPQDITDFDCIGYNLDNFTCSWTDPKNYIKTDYDLEYTAPIRPARYYKTTHKAKSSSKPKGTTTPTTEKAYSCPSPLKPQRSKNNTTFFSCTWDLINKPYYRHSLDSFIFKLFANNTFGNRTWEFPIENHPRIRPNPPVKLQGIGSSPHSIKLRWDNPPSMKDFPRPLDFRVSWWIEQNKNWTAVYFRDSRNRKESEEYQLSNLPYAHCLYDIRVSMKSGVATEERMWSLNASITVWTLPKLPEHPPTTTVGSFEVVEGSRDKYIYWRSIPSYEENGENFTYYVEVNGDPSNESSVKVHHNRALIQNLPDRNYTFRIWSKNSVGLSKESSVIFFPAQKYALKSLSKLLKIDRLNGVYDLQWDESSDPRVTNYTLFWCPAEMDRPYPCEETLEWETIPRGIRNRTLKLPTYNLKKNKSINIYQFAISANGYDTSSGLRWADCTFVDGTGVKLRPYVKKVRPRYIILQWSLECIKSGRIDGFNVSYCIIATPQSQECQPNSWNYQYFENTLRVGQGDLNITGLKPYTGYKIQVKPIVSGAESEFSEPRYNTTWEDTPTEPRDLLVLNKTVRSITIQWKVPLEENGHISNYIILISKRDERNEVKVPAYKNKTLYNTTLVGLLPRTNYTINVLACTTSCSNASIETSTDIGYPGQPEKPTANWDVNDVLNIYWKKPAEAEVKVDFYELEVGTTRDHNSNTFTTYEIKNLSYGNLKECEEDKSQTVYVRVRAVNIRNDFLLRGNWSEKSDFSCTHTASSFWVILVVVMSVISFTVLMGYLIKMGGRKLWEMSKIPSPKFPPGIDPVVDSCEPKEKRSDETLTDTPLLRKDTRPANPSVETSGCCSGTESVSSSVESAGHLSTSDSGTEQPRSPFLGDLEHRVRQRPNVKKTEYSIMEIPQPPWSTKPVQSGYSLIGLSEPPKKSDLESDYLPLSHLPAKSSYIPFPTPQSQEPVKDSSDMQPSSGYVPYLPQEPATKNTAYVLAGEPTPAPAPKLIPKTPVYTAQEDSSSGYVKAPPIETPKLLFPWQQQAPVEPPATGYVIVGDTKPQRGDHGIQKGSTKGYVPHNVKYEGKSLKED